MGKVLSGVLAVIVGVVLTVVVLFVGSSEENKNPCATPGASSASGGSGAAAPAADRLVVIGDSTVVGIQDQLKSRLDSETDYKDTKIDAVSGSTLTEGSSAGVSRTEAAKNDTKADWVIGMGVNDAAGISGGSDDAAGRIKAEMDVLGDQNNVWWPEIAIGEHPSKMNGALDDAKMAEAVKSFNDALHAAEGEHDNLHVVPWSPSAEDFSDDVHFTAAGYKKRTDMIMDAVKSAGTGGDSSAAETAESSGAAATSSESASASADPSESAAQGHGDSGDSGDGGGSGASAPSDDWHGAGDTHTQYVNEGQDVPLGIPADESALSEPQLQHARRIIADGKGRNLPDQVIKGALMAGLQEGGLRMLASRAVPESLEMPNDGITPGDATSVGYFQIQTPMHMPVNEAMDPGKQNAWWYDTFKQMSSPDKEAWEIAADVERPREDLRGEYKKWDDLATKILESQGNIAPSNGACGYGSSAIGEAPADLEEFANKAIEAARKYLGMRYSWGGGNWDGPTKGTPDGGVGDSYGDPENEGFDCSGLTMYAYAQASGMRIKLDHYTTNQQNSPLMKEVPLDDIKAGDLVFFGDISDPHHVGIALNATDMINAPQSGDVVKEQPIADHGDLVSARRLKENPK